MTDAAVDPHYFEQLYAGNPDPWQFASSAYERDKYAATLAALPPRRFKRGLEVGCSIGVLTRQLATRCDTLLGLDVVQAAVEQARTRCADQPGVTFERMMVPDAWPPGRFDLIVFSEVLYYLGPSGLARAAARTLASLAPDGVVVLVNWLGETGAGCSGEDAATAFIAAAGLPPQSAMRTEQYRVDVLSGDGRLL